MSKHILLDLFSGIGGFHKGLHDAGFEFEETYFCEIDKHAIANYKYNFPNAKLLGSVTDILSHDIRPTVITFGWPCQDNSVAGKRKGQVDGTRSGLLFHAVNAIERFRPRFFIAENVKGLYSVNAGEDFYKTLEILTYLNSDSPQYTVEMQLLNTSWVLPQNRERTYFIGHLGTGGIQRIFPLTENDFGAAKRASHTPVVRTITGGGTQEGCTAV
jgi:DNA (cytosine-5)-methyltransferase 1